jgi:hypothetical protein
VENFSFLIKAQNLGNEKLGLGGTKVESEAEKVYHQATSTNLINCGVFQHTI